MTLNTAFHIRAAALSDLDAIKRICLETSFAPDDVRYRALIPLRWATPYVEYNPENCFVVVNAAQADNVGGYILSALDTLSFRQYRFLHYEAQMQAALKEVLPLFSNEEQEDLKALFSLTPPKLDAVEKEIIEEYPAHLHIDISQTLQRRGLGSKLMDRLIAHLKEKKVPGVHLRVAADNALGIRFYRKYGFDALLEADFTLYYGMRI